MAVAGTPFAPPSNQSAVHYHFTNKLGLVRAVLDAVNEMLAPLQPEALGELEKIARKRTPTVREIVSYGFAPYVLLFQQSHEGRMAIRLLSRLTWESGVEAQEILAQKLRPYFLKLVPHFQAALPRKAIEALDFHLYLASNTLIHGLADITVLGRQPKGDVDRLYRERPEDLLRYFYDYLSAGISSRVD